jgi:hypothetical protein
MANPSAAKIDQLFFPLGIPWITAGMSWRKFPAPKAREWLTEMIKKRNAIAHGDEKSRPSRSAPFASGNATAARSARGSNRSSPRIFRWKRATPRPGSRDAASTPPRGEARADNAIEPDGTDRGLRRSEPPHPGARPRPGLFLTRQRRRRRRAPRATVARLAPPQLAWIAKPLHDCGIAA